MKFIKMFFALDFLACGFFGIAQYISTSEIANLFASIFCFICALILFRSTYKKKSAAKQTNNIGSTITTKQLETSEKMLNEPLNQLGKAPSSENVAKVTIQHNTDNTHTSEPVPGVSYIESGTMIFRTDGKEITDEEIPFLIQVGREEAIAKWKIQELTRLIPETYQIMKTTDNPETLCNRYNFIVKKINELASLEQQGLFNTNAFNQYKALISDDNFYNLILLCYQKYTAKAQSELKTQNGINNRINKFWEIIRTNVSAEFYNSKIRKT